ncbi:hypothetical protein L2U69_09575 [Zavarzinia compransoris]|uniref:hypothetical protein n=1 Tax=Zavarzinia marina TaxID=2911065 RepID=UPI001F1E058F|nr:hypothetical protein [Zavarzinia marina]MCF4165891.1 hypothetical protein [Zavarzinia marina]
MPALAALFALLVHLVAPLSPMSGARNTADRALALAFADLCGFGAAAPAGGKAPTDRQPVGRTPHCQVCFTMEHGGNFVAPVLAALAVPGRHGDPEWIQQPLSAPFLVHAVGVQPRGPPTVG